MKNILFALAIPALAVALALSPSAAVAQNDKAKEIKGEITEINLEKMTFTLKPSDATQKEMTLNWAATTKVSVDEKNDAKFSDLKKGDKCTCKYTHDETQKQNNCTEIKVTRKNPEK